MPDTSGPDWVLVVNCGSSSVKLALLDARSGVRRLTMLAEQVGQTAARVVVRRDGEDEHIVRPADPSMTGVLHRMLGLLRDEERQTIRAVGHRVVHGGPRFTAPVVIDDDAVTDLASLAVLAPLHVPLNLLGVQTVRGQLPGLLHVAVFDTAFHQTMPPVAYRYAVPHAWHFELGVRRYGFHGISHQYVSARAAELLGRPIAELRLVTLHLGNGSSATAVLGGQSVDTTMGMTPLEGLVMGTRSGDVDPGVLGYVADRLGLTAAAVVAELNTHSGLLGLSQLSNDMRELCDAAHHGSEAAQLAVDVFCYRAAKAVGSLAVAMDGLDAVVFTGGIGEHAPEVRAGILRRLGVLGLALDEAANTEAGGSTSGRVSLPGPATALVVPTDEELLIAREAAQLAR